MGKGIFFERRSAGVGGMLLLHVVPHDGDSGAGGVHGEPGWQRVADGDGGGDDEPGVDRVPGDVGGIGGPGGERAAVAVGGGVDAGGMRRVRAGAGDGSAAGGEGGARRGVRLLLGGAVDMVLDAGAEREAWGGDGHLRDGAGGGAGSGPVAGHQHGAVAGVPAGVLGSGGGGRADYRTFAGRGGQGRAGASFRSPGGAEGVESGGAGRYSDSVDCDAVHDTVHGHAVVPRADYQTGGDGGSRGIVFRHIRRGVGVSADGVPELFRPGALPPILGDMRGERGGVDAVAEFRRKQRLPDGGGGLHGGRLRHHLLGIAGDGDGDDGQ